MHWAVDFIRLEPSRFLGQASSILLLQADSITWFDLRWLAIADLFSLTCRIEQGNSRGELMPSSNSKAAHMMPNLYLTLFGWIPSWLCEEWCDRPTNLRTGRYSDLPACSFFLKKLICIILLGTKQEANIKSNSYLLELPKAKKTHNLWGNKLDRKHGRNRCQMSNFKVQLQGSVCTIIEISWTTNRAPLVEVQDNMGPYKFVPEKRLGSTTSYTYGRPIQFPRPRYPNGEL